MGGRGERACGARAWRRRRRRKRAPCGMSIFARPNTHQTPAPLPPAAARAGGSRRAPRPRRPRGLGPLLRAHGRRTGSMATTPSLLGLSRACEPAGLSEWGSHVWICGCVSRRCVVVPVRGEEGGARAAMRAREEGRTMESRGLDRADRSIHRAPLAPSRTHTLRFSKQPLARTLPSTPPPQRTTILGARRRQNNALSVLLRNSLCSLLPRACSYTQGNADDDPHASHAVRRRPDAPRRGGGRASGNAGNAPARQHRQRQRRRRLRRPLAPPLAPPLRPSPRPRLARHRLALAPHPCRVRPPRCHRPPLVLPIPHVLFILAAAARRGARRRPRDICLVFLLLRGGRKTARKILSARGPQTHPPPPPSSLG